MKLTNLQQAQTGRKFKRNKDTNFAASGMRKMMPAQLLVMENLEQLWDNKLKISATFQKRKISNAH